MKCTNLIYSKPYIPEPIRLKEEVKPYVCRLAPFADGFEFEWFDKNSDKEHTVTYRERGGEGGTTLPLKESTMKITGLELNKEYEFYVESAEGVKSNLRLVRTDAVPDGAVVVNYLHPEDDQYFFTGHYLGNQSFIRLESGRLLANVGVFGPHTTYATSLALLFYSDDDGATWRYLQDIYPYNWASLFEHRGVIYLLGVNHTRSDLQISCSKDGGETWSVPTVLVYGATHFSPLGGPHRAPMHIVECDGRLYTTFEYGSWSIKSHLPSVLSIDVNDDLMVSENWSYTPFLPFEGKWKEDAEGDQGDTMEGNVIEGPDGTLYEYLRWKNGSVLRLKVDKNDSDKMMEYDCLLDMPVSKTMFRIFPYRGKYCMVANRITERSREWESWTYRNVLSVYRSEDLENWEVTYDVINWENENPLDYGFQYPCMVAEDDKLMLLVRSAYNAPKSCHDSNYILFWNIPAEKLGMD